MSSLLCKCFSLGDDFVALLKKALRPPNRLIPNLSCASLPGEARGVTAVYCLWSSASLCPALLQPLPQAVGLDQHILRISKLLLPLEAKPANWFELGASSQYYPLLHSAFWIEHRFWGDAVSVPG